MSVDRSAEMSKLLLGELSRTRGHVRLTVEGVDSSLIGE